MVIASTASESESSYYCIHEYAECNPEIKDHVSPEWTNTAETCDEYLIESVTFTQGDIMLHRTILATLLLLSIIAAPVLAGDLDWNIEERDGETVAVAKIEKSYDLHTQMMVRDFTGNIEVVNGEAEQASLEFVLGGIKHADKDDLELWIKRMEIDIDTGKRQWEIVGSRSMSNWNHRPWYLDLKIVIPEGTVVDAVAFLGGLDVHDYVGKVRFQTNTGGIYARNCKGDLTLLTQTGGLELVDLEGELDVRTNTGGIVIENVRVSARSAVSSNTGGADICDTWGSLDVMLSTGGAEISGHHENLLVETGTGGIEVHDLSGKVKASTGTGGVHAHRLTDDLSGLDLSSGSGPIGVDLNKAIAATIEVEIDDYDGEHEFRCDFPIEEQKTRNHRYSATVLRHGGGIPISLSTSSGWVQLSESIR